MPAADLATDDLGVALDQVVGGVGDGRAGGLDGDHAGAADRWHRRRACRHRRRRRRPGRRRRARARPGGRCRRAARRPAARTGRTTPSRRAADGRRRLRGASPARPVAVPAGRPWTSPTRPIPPRRQLPRGDRHAQRRFDAGVEPQIGQQRPAAPGGRRGRRAPPRHRAFARRGTRPARRRVAATRTVVRYPVGSTPPPSSTAGSATPPGPPQGVEHESTRRADRWASMVMCCQPHPPQPARRDGQGGVTRSGEASTTATVVARAQSFFSAVSSASTVSPGSAPRTNTTRPPSSLAIASPPATKRSGRRHVSTVTDAEAMAARYRRCRWPVRSRSHRRCCPPTSPASARRSSPWRRPGSTSSSGTSWTASSSPT